MYHPDHEFVITTSIKKGQPPYYVPAGLYFSVNISDTLNMHVRSVRIRLSQVFLQFNILKFF